MTKQIVFLGAGYVTLFAYRNLIKSNKIERLINNGKLKIIVISDRRRHYFHGFTGEVISDTFSQDSICTPLKLLYPLADIHYGKVYEVSPFAKKVKYKKPNGSNTIRYDELIIGLGTKDKTPIEVNSDNYFAIKKVNGLPKFIDHFKNGFLNNSQAGNRRNFAIIGGGFTGVEVASNLEEMLKEKFEQLEFSIKIITSGSVILKKWKAKQPSLHRYIEKVLRKKNIEIITEKRAVALEDKVLSLKDGSVIKNCLVINASGQEAVNVDGLNYLTALESNRYKGDSYLLSKFNKSIWVGGDASLVDRPFSKNKKCPHDALWAIMQGKHIGKNIKRRVLNKKLKKFKFPGLGVAACFGKHKAAVEIFNIPFTGTVAYYLRMVLFMYFFPKTNRLIKKEVTGRSTNIKVQEVEYQS